MKTETEPNYKDEAYQKRVMAAAIDGTQCQYFHHGLDEWVDEKGWKAVAQSVGSGTRVRIKPAPDPYAELKAAHAAGKVIQKRLNSAGENWYDTKSPSFLSEPEFYRIKPDPITVPLEASDLPAVCWLRQPQWNPNCGNLVVSVEREGIWMINDLYVGFSELMRDGWQYSPDRQNWRPCHKPA